MLISGSGSSTSYRLCTFTLAVFSWSGRSVGVAHGASTMPLTRTPTTAGEEEEPQGDVRIRR
jgi:hypothetical protein